MSILTRQQEFVEDFNFFDDWLDKYTHLMSLRKRLSPFPRDKKDQKHMIKGCQSKVWLCVDINDNLFTFYGISDSSIVSGLIALLLKVYNGSNAKEILESDISFMDLIGFSQHLSPARNNGLHSMINYVYNTALRHNDEKKS
jgi:cysteine desulfuration protein SufE